MSQDVRRVDGGGRMGSRSFGGGGRPRFFRGDGRGGGRPGGPQGGPRMGPGRAGGFRPGVGRGGPMGQRQEDMPMLGGGRGRAPAMPKKQLQGYWGADKKKQQPSSSDGPSGPMSTVDTPKASGGPSSSNVKSAMVPTAAKPQAQSGLTLQQRKPQRLQSVPVDKIKISGSVVLNIIKHCQGGGHTQSSKVRTGHLYGLKYPQSGKTEISYSIPTPDTLKTRTEDAEFCKTYMSCVESTGVDQMEVGWYRSCTNGNFYDESTVTRCFEWQSNNEHAFVLVFDLSATVKSGRLVLRCFQLTPEFFALRQSGDRSGMGHTALHEREITFHNIFREIPVSVHNSYLAHAFLFEHQNACPFDRLSHNANADVSQGLTALGKCIEEYQPLQSQYRAWRAQVNRVLNQRQVAEDQGAGSAAFVATKYPFPPEPSRLKSMLVLAQMEEYSSAIKKSTIQTQSNLQIQASLDV